MMEGGPTRLSRLFPEKTNYSFGKLNFHRENCHSEGKTHFSRGKVSLLRENSLFLGKSDSVKGTLTFPMEKFQC